MNYRAMIKQRFPVLENVLRRNACLMSLAVKVESALMRRNIRRSTKQLKGTHRLVTEDAARYLKQARSQGLFNYQWYCDVQQRGFESELHAFGDYLHKSPFSAVSPSPAFDNLSYAKRNLDIYHAGISPLTHYLSSGKEEGRVVVPFQPKWKPTDRLVIKSDLKAIKTLKIAVSLHVFYEDFIEYYARCLRSFPVSVDLYISVSDIAYQQSIDKHLASLDCVNTIEVAEVPNRGRNFGPMLVEFGNKLLDYDLFCHLHSKKSLYSGRQQTQWADYLGEYLLNDHHVISKMLTYMVSNPECGLYYPTSFSMMPDWVNHWLKNKPYRGEFFTQWEIEDHRDFLPYPVGGMFWAKPQALKPLLDKVHSYEDFPAEPLPNDGSELHALERCIGLLAEKSGYSQLFYYPELGSFTHDQSYVFANYVNNAEELYHKLAPFETISFDVFDTLVRRSHFVPDYAKLKLGKHLQQQGVVNDAHEFVKARNQAEFEVRKQNNFQGDVTIFTTYQQLAKTYQWDEDTANQYAEMEFAYDLEMIESKDEMVDIANRFITQGKKVYIISDTYYTEYQIVLMLRKAGVANGYQLFVSSEKGLRKDNATMWSYIAGELKNKARFVHVGDNAVADAQLPGDFGLANLHILNPADKWQAAGWHNPLVGDDQLNEQLILKWGPLISQFGRYPFLGE